MQGLQAFDIAMNSSDSPDAARSAKFGKFLVHDYHPHGVDRRSAREDHANRRDAMIRIVISRLKPKALSANLRKARRYPIICPRS